MSQIEKSVALPKRKQCRLHSIAGLLLMGASFAVSGCELPEDGAVADGVTDPGFNPDAGSSPTVIPNATVLLERDDLLAIAPAGVHVPPQVLRDIEEQLQHDPKRTLHGKIQVVYRGPIDFNFSGDQGFRSGNVDIANLRAYTQLQRGVPGERVMWANMESERLYLVQYAQPAWDDLKQVAPLEEFTPAPAPPVDDPEGADFDFDWMRGKRYRRDTRGVLVGKDTRHRVFGENEPVQGKLFTRLLSMGGGTGAMVGRRHFMTAAHVLVEYEELKDSIKVLDPSIRAGRNGNTQVGETARATHVWWMADWTPETSGTELRGFDMAWGVMDEPLGDDTGYFGLLSASTAHIRENSMTIRNAGYASCTPGNDPIPPDCLRRHVVLDSNNCDILGEDEPDTLGWGRAVAHGCDANRGHSGSPLVVTNNGSLYVWAIHSGHANRTNYAARLTRNRHRNLMSEMFDRFPRDQ